jgi:hypothetical protein
MLKIPPFRQKRGSNLGCTVQPIQYMLTVKRFGESEILATCCDPYFYVFDLKENKVLKNKTASTFLDKRFFFNWSLFRRV